MAHSKNNSETYRFILTQHFKNQLKAYLKKDPGLKARFLREMDEKKIENFIRISGAILKMRISGQNSGKSGAYRMYLFLFKTRNYLIPIAIFHKSEKSDLTSKELSGHLRATKIELGLT